MANKEVLTEEQWNTKQIERSKNHLIDLKKRLKGNTSEEMQRILARDIVEAEEKLKDYMSLRTILTGD